MTAPAAPAPKKRNPWLIGCLVVLLVLLIGGGAVLLLGLYAAKREYDKFGPQAQQALEEARKAAAQVQAAAGTAQVLAQGAEAQARLAMASRAVATTQDMNVVACPPDPARVNIPVDADWFRQMSSGIPRTAAGTPWMRHAVFENLANAGLAANASDELLAQAATAADRDLSDAGIVTVIHTSKLEPTHFEGFAQVVKYPSGDSICLVPFSADGAKAEDLPRAFRKAEEAALGK